MGSMIDDGGSMYIWDKTPVMNSETWLTGQVLDENNFAKHPKNVYNCRSRIRKIQRFESRALNMSDAQVLDARPTHKGHLVYRQTS